MPGRAKIDRPITPTEVAVVREALVRVPVSPWLTGLGDALETLRAVDQCDCGCDSVDFTPHDPSRPSKPIADGVGTTPAGGTVGIIIWGREDAVTGLEIYDLGAGDNDLRLPLVATIRSFTAGAV
jgi:hypothetical protein